MAFRSTRPPGGSEEGRRAAVPLARRLAEYLLAILAGNVLYLLTEPHLPEVLQHSIFRVDWGLGLDFAICAGFYGIIRLLRL